MSRNFELLERIAKEELLTPGGTPEILPPPIPFPALQGLAKEEITKLAQRLFFRGGHAGGPKIVSFSGIARDDRSSWIHARVAEYLATQADTSVCLVDAGNFTSPPVTHDHYDVGNRNGLTPALTTDGPNQVLCNTTPHQEIFKAAAFEPAKPGLDANVGRWRARFAELREEFAHVLVSAPPLACESEAILTGQLATMESSWYDLSKRIRAGEIPSAKQKNTWKPPRCKYSGRCWINAGSPFRSFCTAGSN